jgi:hypothetical protein
VPKPGDEIWDCFEEHYRVYVTCADCLCFAGCRCDDRRACMHALLMHAQRAERQLSASG